MPIFLWQEKSDREVSQKAFHCLAYFTSKTLKRNFNLLHFVAFFHVASLLSTGVDNEKVGVDNEKALELTNSTVFHRGRQ